MKVAVLNYTGSVGKTVAASHLLAPRMPDVEIIAVESTNETAADLGLEVEKMRGRQFGRLFRKLLTAQSAIVDVGASNIEDFLAEIMKFEDAHLEIDYYVLPVIPSGRAMRETIKTIQALVGMQIPAERIRILFNRVDSDVKDEFAPIFGYALQSKGFIANPEAAIFETHVFDLLASKRITISEIVADGTDYRQQIREADPEDLDLLERLSDLYALQAQAKPINRQLDQVFTALFV